MLKNKKFLLTLFVFLLLITAPYFYAIFTAPPGFTFTGFLTNFYDGHSYLAKTQQGYEGRWLFSLDYSPEISAGAFINVQYLFLGHLIRWLGGTNIVLWMHGFRVAMSAILAIALYDFMTHTFPEDETLRWRAYWLSLFGAGLGWLLIFSDYFAMDFWVAEAYPFLSSYTNLHFPLGLALQLWLLRPDESEPTLRDGITLTLASVILAFVSAFSVPVVLAVWGGVFFLRWLASENPWPIFWRGFWIGLGGLPILIYDYFAILADPGLSGWNAQNITVSPPVWDVLLSFSPALILALPGLYYAWHRKQIKNQILISWVALCFVLAFTPFPLQRRFFIGYSIPLAALAVFGISTIVKQPRQRTAWLALFFLALPTNLILLLGSIFGAKSVSPQLFLYPDEKTAFAWLDEHAPADSLIFAAPETGTFLPAYTTSRVIYGHPFESLHAEAREQYLLDFYAGAVGQAQAERFFEEYQVDYLFFGPRELALGELDWLDEFEIVFEEGEVKIYVIHP